MSSLPSSWEKLMGLAFGELMFSFFDSQLNKYIFVGVVGLFFYLLLRSILIPVNWVYLMVSFLLARGLISLIWILTRAGRLYQRYKDKGVGVWLRASLNRRLGPDQKNYFPQVNKEKKTIEGLSLKKLVRRYGSPLFIVSEKQLVRKYRLLAKTLNDHYGHNYSIAYSIKTNNLSSIGSLFKKQGAEAEVGSEYEYYLAKKLGYLDKNIVFNGPGKAGGLEAAVLRGARVNLDNYQELDYLAKLATRKKKSLKVGLRVNTTIGGKSSRFGFNIENQEANQAVDLIAGANYLNLSGIHCHLGSNISRAYYYQTYLEKVCRFISEIKFKYNCRLKYIDCGGGFPVPGSGADEAGFPYTISDYIAAMVQPIKRFGLSELRLIVEPGRFLVDEGVVLLATVLSSDKKGKRVLVTVDASTSLLPLALTRKQQVSSLSLSWRRLRCKERYQTTIYGASCKENDVLVDKQLLGWLGVGDMVVFYNAGAYNISESTQFMFPRPAVVSVVGGKAKLSRKAESNIDLLRLDR